MWLNEVKYVVDRYPALAVYEYTAIRRMLDLLVEGYLPQQIFYDLECPVEVSDIYAVAKDSEFKKYKSNYLRHNRRQRLQVAASYYPKGMEILNSIATDNAISIDERAKAATALAKISLDAEKLLVTKEEVDELYSDLQEVANVS